MRNRTGAIVAIACVVAAAGIGSSFVFAAGPGGTYDATLARTASAQVADRFPSESERFQIARLVRMPNDSGFFGAIAHANSGQITIPGCNTWPFVAPECLTTRLQPQAAAPTPPPVAPVQRAAAPVPHANDNAPAPAPVPAATPVKPVAVVAAAMPVAMPAVAPPAISMPPSAAVSTPSCRQNLATVSVKLEKALAHAKGARAGGAREICAAYQQDFFAMVQAREVTAMCKSGTERDQDLGRIDTAVEDINGAIARSCGG